MANASQNLSAKQTKFAHPTYVALAPIWQQLRDVREGSGGFISGEYLVAHPRENIVTTSKRRNEDGTETVEVTVTKKPTRKLIARRTLASYENFAETIVLALKAALFREQPTRRVGDGSVKDAPKTEIEEWWEDVDGAGTHIDDFMQAAWDLAGTFGHVHLYMDLPENTDAMTAADQKMPFLRVYTPLDALDWMIDDLGQMTAIKFSEVTPRTTLDEPLRPNVDTRMRMVDATSWRLYDTKGASVDSGDHKFGRLPVVTLYANRRPMTQLVGSSVLGDPRLYIDLFNIVSEIRELLRNQTFGILNVPLGTGDGAMTVNEAQTMMANSSGTENILFSGAKADFISPSAENVIVYHAEFQRKLRVIYRLVALSWEADSKDAEAEGSLKLKREDMGQRLSGYADELEKADYLLAEMFYRSLYQDDGPKRLEKDQVQIKYPDTFDMTPFEQVLEQAEAAMSLGMPPLFLKELRKRLARKFDGMADLPTSIMDEIDKQIDSAADDLTPAEKQAGQIEMQKEALKASGKPTIPKVAA
jgi:hypothetical protein